MSTDIQTIGGKPSRSVTYTKLLHHIREAQDQAAVMAHLHGEDNDMDKLHRQGWLGIQELLGRMATQITHLATKGIMQ